MDHPISDLDLARQLRTVRRLADRVRRLERGTDIPAWESAVARFVLAYDAVPAPLRPPMASLFPDGAP